MFRLRLSVRAVVCCAIVISLLLLGRHGSGLVSASSTQVGKIILVKPQGANNKSDASKHPVKLEKGKVEVTWSDPAAKLVFQVYQKNKLVKEYRDVASGSAVDLSHVAVDIPTELKGWVAGRTEPEFAVWVILKN